MHRTTTQLQPTPSGARIVKILIAGLLTAAALEFVNGVLTFMLPPFLVITPICLAFALAIALRGKQRYS
jgi:hypothetical protein